MKLALETEYKSSKFPSGYFIFLLSPQLSFFETAVDPETPDKDFCCFHSKRKYMLTTRMQYYLFFGIKTLTASYHPIWNAAVVRINKTLLDTVVTLKSSKYRFCSLGFVVRSEMWHSRPSKVG